MPTLCHSTRPRSATGLICSKASAKPCNGARDLRERVAAKDMPGARKAWISARAGWERSEVFTAGFVPELDAKIDAWPNADSGFHAIEAKLFGANHIDAERETDALVDHLSNLHGKLRDIALTPQGLLDGTVRPGLRGRREQGRRRRIPDQRNVAGRHAQQRRRDSNSLIAQFSRASSRPPTESSPMRWTQGLRQLKTIWRREVCRRVDIRALRRASEELVITLQGAATKLGLQRPTLEAATR